MNRPHLITRRAQSSGFTLVELLVVIAIIAILAGVVLSAGGAALRAAQRAKAANLASQIQTASINYFTEYSVYPVPTGTAAGDYFIDDTNATGWKNYIEALCGNVSPYSGTTGITGLTVTNTRVIPFLQLKASDVDANDAPLNPITYSTAHPYFNLGIDNDYSNVVGDTGTPPSGGIPSGIPNFSTSTQGSMTVYAAPKAPTAGVIVWANCNTATTAAKMNPGFYVHTY